MTLSLIGRIKKLDGPDREVDVAIMAACFPEWAKPEPPYYAPHCIGDEPIYWHAPDWLRKRPCPKLTASLDAVVALVERVRPERRIAHIGEQVDDNGRYIGGWSVRLHCPLKQLRRNLAFGSAPTPALALLLALLRSLGEEDE